MTNSESHMIPVVGQEQKLGFPDLVPDHISSHRFCFVLKYPVINSCVKKQMRNKGHFISNSKYLSINSLTATVISELILTL